MNENITTPPIEGLTLTGENLKTFKNAIKTGYYKSLLKEGIINHSEFEKLMLILNRAK